jgi:hypothetical protein
MYEKRWLIVVDELLFGRILAFFLSAYFARKFRCG